jgi:uncharacterized protein YeaO (DUF488 family)
MVDLQRDLELLIGAERTAGLRDALAVDWGAPPSAAAVDGVAGVGNWKIGRADEREVWLWWRIGVIRLKRVYDPATPDDGYRVLVERLWPRGVSKEKAQLDDWPKAITPSDDLRRWYGHDPQKWDEFQDRYQQELQSADAQAVLDDLTERARNGTVTLVYASKDSDISCSAVLQRLLNDRVRQ